MHADSCERNAVADTRPGDAATLRGLLPVSLLLLLVLLLLP